MNLMSNLILLQVYVAVFLKESPSLRKILIMIMIIVSIIHRFETGFHQSIPRSNRTYAIPQEWDQELNIQRFGFHGASHHYIADRVADKFNRSDLKIISCHLGGSSSLTAIRDGKSVATSMGASPQSGILQNNRVGDFDPFTLPLIIRQTGLSLEAVLEKLANSGGLLGISGKSGDVRDLEQAAAAGRVSYYR